MSDEPLKVSDTKNRRGRPNAFSDTMMAMQKRLYGKKSHRTLIHHCYLTVAIGAIMECPDKEEYLWLMDEKRIAAGYESMRHNILVELGRVLQDYGEEHFWEWCKVLCRDTPKTHDAVTSIRHWSNDKH